MSIALSSSPRCARVRHPGRAPALRRAAFRRASKAGQTGYAGSIALAALLGAAGCKDAREAPVYEAQVTVALTVRSADVAAGQLVSAIDLSTVPHDPYDAFLTNARLRSRSELARIDLEAISLELASATGGVTSLGEVLSGPVEAVLFLDGAGGAATVAGAVDLGDLPLDEAELLPGFPDAVTAAQHREMLASGFEVGLRGAAAAGFAAREAEVKLELKLTFAAYRLAAPEADE